MENNCEKYHELGLNIVNQMEENEFKKYREELEQRKPNKIAFSIQEITDAILSDTRYNNLNRDNKLISYKSLPLELKKLVCKLNNWYLPDNRKIIGKLIEYEDIPTELKILVEKNKVIILEEWLYSKEWIIIRYSQELNTLLVVWNSQIYTIFDFYKDDNAIRLYPDLPIELEKLIKKEMYYILKKWYYSKDNISLRYNVKEKSLVIFDLTPWEQKNYKILWFK